MDALFRFFGFLGCHQRPERSFFIRGRQLPLCARCTGILAGYVLGGALFVFGLVPPVWICGLALLPSLIDWVLQTFFFRESTNIRRLATGFLFGWGLITLALSAVARVLSLIGR